ncbi:unnamed protein product [Coregonus sp. 'balchen']|nr:unnamed protein product [Coregonus sp. 'balchen']
MGGCQSHPSAAETHKVPQPSDITKLGDNNNELVMEERPYLQQQYVSERITHTDMTALTALPPGLDQAEWLASNRSVFPAGFVFLVQKVFLLLFRVLAHIYWSHYREALVLGLHPHLNTLFTHLTHFSLQHDLLEAEHTQPLQDLIIALGQHSLT